MKLTTQQINQVKYFLNTNVGFQTKLTIIFPLLDELSKHLYKNKANKERMVNFFNDYLTLDHLIIKKINIKNSDGNVLFFANGHSLGEVVYDLRCYLLHEANCGFEIRFEEGCLFGSEEDIIGKNYYILGADLQNRLFRIFINNKEIKNKENDQFLKSLGDNTFFIDSYKNIEFRKYDVCQEVTYDRSIIGGAVHNQNNTLLKINLVNSKIGVK